jgi:N-acyl homoserine lactone hydrolase
MTVLRGFTKRHAIFFFAVLAIAVASVPWISSAQQKPKPPKNVRLYVFDCGWIKGLTPERFGYKKGDLPTSAAGVDTVDIPVPCFLIVDPKGTMMWDVGVIQDSAFGADGAPVKQRAFYAEKTLKSQLAQIGYQPEDITYLALSHNHGDHTANANEFAASTWLVRQNERDLMFGNPPLNNIKEYDALKNSKTIIIDKDEYDVFGDGKVIIKSTPGHTIGHQSLVVKLKKTGPVILAGDMYHFQQDMASGNVPQGEYNVDQTHASRKMIEAYAKKIKAQIWIQHDPIATPKLKKSPEFYE